MPADVSKERDIETLRKMATLLEVENQFLHEKLASLSEQVAELRGQASPEQLTLAIAELQEKLDSANRRLYGASSERRGEEAEPAAKKPQTGHGPTPQPDLPIRDVDIECDPDELECRSCGGALEPMKGVTEDSEGISLVRRQFFIERIKRHKYRCRCGGDVRTAATNGPLVPGGRYSVEVAAHVAEQKYLDHVPLDRQRRSMARQGLSVTTSTLWDQIDALAEYLEPSYELLRQYILGADVIGVDETTWPLLRSKPTKKWWAWTMCCPGAVFYDINSSRSAKAAHEIVGDFAGTIVCDGYKAYETLAKRQHDLRLALCWSHARRKFVEAEPNYPECAEAIELIGQLFAIDRDIANPMECEGDRKLDAIEARRRARGERAPPILDALKKWALGRRGLPRSGIRKAVDYLLGHWTALTVFVDDPLVPLDNNASERALRGLVIGRKNHYGSKSERGTYVAAILYSVMETAKQNGLDPFQWVIDTVYRRKLDPSVVPLPLA